MTAGSASMPGSCKISFARSTSSSAIWTRTPPMAFEYSQSVWTMFSSWMYAGTPPASSLKRSMCASSGLLNVATVSIWKAKVDRRDYSLANVPRQVSLAGGAGGSQASGAKALGLLCSSQALCRSGGMSNWCSSKLPTGQRLTGRAC